jgi:hypothetical protein
MESAMELRKLPGRLGKLKATFTLSSAGYCAAHWLIAHNFSIFVLSGALVFGAAAATAVAWLAEWFSTSAIAADDR